MTAVAPGAAHDAELLASLRARLDETMGEALRGRREAVVLDAPAYRNAGDLLILRGTLDALRRLGVRVRWIQDWTLTSWSPLAALRAEIGVLLQGGGNFGGLYPGHDDYRARVLGALPDPSAAVVMPQSVHFPDPAAEARARELYGSFPHASYLVRDSPSLNALRAAVPSVGASVILCPDAAFGTVLRRQSPALNDIFVLQRQDAESTGADLLGSMMSLDATIAHGDWPSFTTKRPAYRTLGRMTSLGERARATAQRSPEYLRPLATGTVERVWMRPQRVVLQAHVADHVTQIRRTIESGRVLVTDRLHGHVAATLMGVPNVALNNADGKVSALINEWTHEFSTTRFAETPVEAAVETRGLLSS